MKIYYIANVRIPTEKAHGLQIMKMCEAFVLSGEVMELFVPRRLNKIKSEPFDYYGVKRIFKIKKLPCLDLICLDFILGNLAFWVQSMSFFLAAKIYLIFRQSGVVYARDEFAGFFFNNLVLEVHSLSKKIKARQKKIWKKARAILVLTSLIKEILRQQGVNQDKIMVAPDGVDLERFDITVSKEEARRMKNLPVEKKIVLYSGSFYLYDWKGVDVFLEAAKFFGEDILFVLVGGGAKEIALMRQKHNLLNILLVGRQPHKEIVFFLKAADVLILPNKSDDPVSEKYTSPLKLFEYMAARRPIVASDLPSIREVLNESSAVLVAPDRPEEIVRGIEIILADPGFGDKIAKQALVDVSQKYTWDQRAKNIINFIRRLLSYG